MKVHFIETGLLKLDGGAMFGVVPKSMWNRLNPADENNMCTWAMRCLLVDTGDKKILVDTGLGNKQDERFRSHFHPHGDDTLEQSLRAKGLTPSDITDVLLTHLHFDHVGGAVIKTTAGELVPAFPNATYWTNEAHYQWALHPNPREKASFLKENIVPLWEHGVLQFIPVGADDYNWLPDIQIRFVYGHTEAMMIPIFNIADQKAFFCADVIPSSYHLGLPFVMSYDIRPLLSIPEKERILNEAAEKGHVLIFEHDPRLPAATVHLDGKGKYVVKSNVFDLGSESTPT